jgi:hypothetical protein
MSITIGPPLETELRAKASAQGITVEAYLERLVKADREALVELENLAIEGLNSGEAVAPGPEYWADKHRRLDERFKSAR